MSNDSLADTARTGLLVSPAEWAHRIGRRLVSRTGVKGALSLVDQALVSAANFLASIFVGRFGGPAELGLYFQGFTVIAVLLTAQIALIAVPYTIYSPRKQGGKDKTFAGSALAHQLMLSLAVVALLLLAALVLWGTLDKPALAAVTATVAVGAPFVLMREFARRFCFAHMEIGRGLLLDLVTVTGQLAAFVWLSWNGQLTAVTALAVLAAACAISGLGWLFVCRREFHLVWKQALADLAHNFSLAMWVFLSDFGAALIALSGGVLTIFLLGEREAGIYAACWTVSQAVNPLLFGTFNLLSPTAARAYANGGKPEVRRVMFTVTPFIVALLLGWCIFLLLFGELIIQALYGDDFLSTTWVVTWLAASVLMRALGVIAGQGLQTIDRPRFGFYSNVLALCGLALSVPLLIPTWGVTGAAMCICAAEATIFVTRMLAFLSLSRAPAPCEVPT
ncbi:MAG: lipopolysaccharide biosynthesis protein [Planctomycetota bacterium]|nr:MAG: lipopolysaccharide biosynthesis protein [Planctomycetota bacterium]REJ94628.1 MAG: lipopolysaccharide biosynthesis protein [Planctomycetota bacterium]